MVKPIAGKKNSRLVARLEKASRALQEENLHGAETLCRKILKAHGNQPDALHLLGLTCFKAGNTAGAVEYIGRAIARHGGVPSYHHHLAEILRTTGQPEKSLDPYRRAIELNPDYAEAMFGLGNAMLQLGRLGEATSMLRGGLGHQPQDVEALCDLGQALQRQGRTEDAIEVYKKALEIHSQYWPAHILLGSAFIRINDIDAGLLHLRKATELAADRIETHNALTKALLDAGDVERAIAHFDQLILSKPEFAEAYASLGMCLQQVGRFEESIACYRRALAIDPNLARAHFNLTLSNVHDDDAREILEKRLGSRDVGDSERIMLGFALGSILHRDSLYEDAFEQYRLANSTKARYSYFDIELFERTVEGMRQFFDDEFFARNGGLGIESELPVLVVGMPRSGTTLVEQIIAAHSQAAGAGELSYLADVVEYIPTILATDRAFPECLNTVRSDQLAKIARDYLALLKTQAPDATRIADKMPSNYLRLGLFTLLFKKARVIHCRRDPFDTALSCYFQNFAMDNDFTTDLSTLGRVYAAYTRLMEHWERTLPLKMLSIDYEELVVNSESSIRRIIRYCGLEWEPGCLEFHRHQRQIRTSSFWQARQPMYTSAIGRSRSYREQLAPFAKEIA